MDAHAGSGAGHVSETDDATPTSKAHRHALIFICLTILIDTIGFGIVIPVLPNLLMSVGKIDLAEATRTGGWLLVVYAGLQFVCGPLLGNLSDRFGRRPVLLLSLLAFGIDYFLMALAPSLAWLFVGRAIAGIAGAVYAPAGAYIADISTPEKRAGSFGMMGAMFGLGFIIGPALGGIIAQFGDRAPFFAASAIALLNLVYGYFVLPESLPKEQRRPFSLARANPLGTFVALARYPAVIALAAAMFLWQLAHQVYPATWSFFAKARFDWSPAAIGLSLAFTGATMVLVQFFVTKPAVKRFGENRAAMIGVTSGVLGFVINAVATEGWVVYVAMTVGALQGLTYASMQGLMSRQVPANAQGELQGGVASVASLSSIIGPYVMSQALASYSDANAPVYFPGAAFVLAAGLGTACLVVLATQLRPRVAANSA